MTIDECAEKWSIQIERIICILESEFLMLNEQQLTYRIHVRGCNIKEIMNQLYKLNAGLLHKMNQGISIPNEKKEKQEYEPGWPGKYFLSHTRFSVIVKNEKMCFPSKSPAGNNVFHGILEQQNKLKEFISLSARLDINKKIVPFRLFGLIKLTFAEAIEYAVLCQKSHFAIARHLLKLQS
jgi:hypothetical protein